MKDDFWDEVLRLIHEYDSQRPQLKNENRLYYNEHDGTLIGLWKNDYPEGSNYIILDNLEVFNNTNSLHLRVKNKKLIVLDIKKPNKKRLEKSITGFKTVKGHAALLLEENEIYQYVEYYDRTNC